MRKLAYSDFKEGELLGTGSYSTVRLCTRDGKDYAMKIMEEEAYFEGEKRKIRQNGARHFELAGPSQHRGNALVLSGRIQSLFCVGLLLRG